MRVGEEAGTPEAAFVRTRLPVFQWGLGICHVPVFGGFTIGDPAGVTMCSGASSASKLIPVCLPMVARNLGHADTRMPFAQARPVLDRIRPTSDHWIGNG